MTVRPAELLLVAREAAMVLAGRPLQKVVATEPQSFAFGFPGAWLLVSVDRRFGRVHLLASRPPGTGEAAPSFVMLLRKQLAGLRLAAIEAVAGQRALGLGFARGDVRRRLLIFLFGAGPRLVLLDDEGRPLGAFPPPPAEQQDALPLALPAPRPDDRPARFPAENISAAIAAHYGLDEQRFALEALRTRAAAAARHALEKLRRREQAVAVDLARLEHAAVLRRHADLLLAHLGEVPRGASQITLPDDFGEGAPVAVALDPARSATENAARMYHQYRRLTRSRPAVERRLADTRAERERLELRLASIVSADPDELAALTIPGAGPGVRAAETAGAARARGTPRTRSGQPRAVPYRAFASATGVPILVGKGADKNDELTFRVARGNDLWLHTRDVPGAHVVVPLAGRPVEEATLLDAATLALWFSPARPRDDLSDEALRQVQADVTYAPRKLVRKPRGAAPGRVSVAGGRTIRIRLEPERLKRLLASRDEA